MSDSVAREKPQPSPLRSLLTSPPVAAVLWVLLAGLALEFIPGAARWRLWHRPLPPLASAPAAPSPLDTYGEARLETVTTTRRELALPERVVLPAAPAGPIAATSQTPFDVPRVDAERPPLPIVDPEGSLEPFYRALARSRRAQATGDAPVPVTRILYHGDSVVASDYVTATLRRKLQAEFGDAGHGFVLIADAWPAYFHNDVFRFASRGFELSRVVGPYAKDGLYGLGGVSFKAPPGVRSRVGTAQTGRFGRAASRFELHYLKQPFGGELEVNVDGERIAVLSTEAPSATSAFYEVAVPDGEHLFEVVTKTRFTRMFGFVLERARPGVVLDAIGIQGARLRFLDKQDDAHWAGQLQHRRPNLIVYQFGANESGDGFAYSMADYHATMKAVLEQGRAAVPDAGCLVLSAMDRARKQGQWLVTLPIIPHIVREQEATAREVGCAYFDTFKAMGGRGSMAQWVKRGLGQADLTHPTGYGAEVLGNWLFQALMQGFNEHLKEPQEKLERPASETPQ